MAHTQRGRHKNTASGVSEGSGDDDTDAATCTRATLDVSVTLTSRVGAARRRATLTHSFSLTLASSSSLRFLSRNLSPLYFYPLIRPHYSPLRDDLEIEYEYFPFNGLHCTPVTLFTVSS